MFRPFLFLLLCCSTVDGFPAPKPIEPPTPPRAQELIVGTWEFVDQRPEMIFVRYEFAADGTMQALTAGQEALAEGKYRILDGMLLSWEVSWTIPGKGWKSSTQEKIKSISSKEIVFSRGMVFRRIQ
jgi:hypothetical protein